MYRDIDHLVYIAAFRYALGRSTYIVSTIAKALLEANLSDDDKRLIIKEINDTNGKLGMDMDERVWMQVKDSFEKDLAWKEKESMKLKENADIDQLGEVVDNEGFWYGLTNGYLNINDVLDDEEDIRKVKDALKVLKEFEELIPL